MNSNSIIQILLPRAHLDSDSKALQNLVASSTDDMHADDALFWANADQFEHRRLFVLFVYLGEV